MRRLLLLVVFLFIVPFAYAQACGDGTLNFGEECDLPGQDAACPGYCQVPGCVCAKEVDAVLYDLYSGHNLLFSKVMDLAHISKNKVISDEFDVIQFGLRQAFLNPPNGSCQDPPAMFMLTAEYSPYGKENEIDAFNNYLLFVLSDASLRQQLNVSDAQYDNASTLQSLAETYLASRDYLRSAQAKCCAYNQLIENETLYLADNGSCEILEFCGDGKIKPGEECGEPGLSCPAGETCINCHCYPPTTRTGGGGGNRPVTQFAAGCCKATGERAEYYCCGGQDLVTPGGTHINCCAQPELPYCSAYCELLNCVAPYYLDALGHCVLSETVEKVQTPAPVPVVQQSECGPGYVLKDGRCVQKQEDAVKPVVEEQIAENGKVSISYFVPGILIGLLLLAFLLFRRKPDVQSKVSVAGVQPKAGNIDSMKSELADIEKSYEKLDKMIKSIKGGKL